MEDDPFAACPTDTGVAKPAALPMAVDSILTPGSRSFRLSLSLARSLALALLLSRSRRRRRVLTGRSRLKLSRVRSRLQSPRAGLYRHARLSRPRSNAGLPCVSEFSPVVTSTASARDQGSVSGQHPVWLFRVIRNIFRGYAVLPMIATARHLQRRAIREHARP